MRRWWGIRAENPSQLMVDRLFTVPTGSLGAWERAQAGPLERGVGPEAP